MTASLYSFSYVCTRCGISPNTLRRYIREGLISPIYTDQGHTAFDQVTIERLEIIKRLRCELGVNLAGIDIILRLTARIRELQALTPEKREPATPAASQQGPKGHTVRNAPQRIVGQHLITMESQE